jgi:hypothetical protein
MKDKRTILFCISLKFKAKRFIKLFSLLIMQISQKIIDYAIWYYLKYYPSVTKLKQKLREKFSFNSLR